MKLVDNWTSAWRWLSVQLSAVAMAVQVAVLAFPGEIKAWLPDSVTHWTAAGLLLAAIFGRLIEQKKPADG